MFALLSGRLGDISGTADTSKYSFTLDDKGCATIELSFADYINDGAPDYVEILDADGEPVYMTKFDISMTDIPLSSMYGVKISCKDDTTKEHFENATAKIVYKPTLEADPEVIAEKSMSGGKANVMFEKSKYEFMNKDFWLFIYDESGEIILDSRDLSKSFSKRKSVEKVTLEYSPYVEGDRLKIKESSVTILGTGGQEKITVRSGEIGFTRSKNPDIATAAGEYINAHSAGTTTIIFEDMWGNKEYVKVTVVDVNNFFDGYYRVSLISETSTMPDSTDKTYEPSGGSYVFVQMHLDEQGSPETIRTQNEDGWTDFFGKNPETQKFTKLKDGKYDADDYLEEVTVNSFKRHIITHYDVNQINLHWTVHQTYLYQLTGFDSFPPAGTTSLGY